MAEEKNFLQTIKLEISKNFKLIPYERLAFHKILGILKSESGESILIKELDRGDQIRESAIKILKNFSSSEVSSVFFKIFAEQDLSEQEIIDILEHFENFGQEENFSQLLSFSDKILNQEEGEEINVRRIEAFFKSIASIGKNDETLFQYLSSIVDDENYPSAIKKYAILALYSFKNIPYFEKILKMENMDLNFSVFRSISLLNDMLLNSKKESNEEDALFTFSSEKEDKVVLEIRVLLGKISSKFDLFSTEVKLTYIDAMISGNHREYLIYVMKALTSKNEEMISMVLTIIYKRINIIRDPDKLFRSLIALSNEKKENNDLIIEIFVKYFSKDIKNRQFNILKNKLYGYIIVTLETYFENYRKEFMIKEVMEKSFPENIQKIRHLILEKMTPALKKKIISYLLHDESTAINEIIEQIGQWSHFVAKKEKIDLFAFIEVLYDNDKKTREISASRLENLNFEKRYLRNRIIRLCEIIARLNIVDAASQLVNIYNYLKKYPDEILIDQIMRTLSSLNYSYMLGEIEVFLNTGTSEEKKNFLEYLSFFTEQRSLNILLEFLISKTDQVDENVAFAFDILLNRDILSNGTANQFFKNVIEKNLNKSFVIKAIKGIGLCAFPQDLEYLNDLFKKTEEKDFKSQILEAITSLVLNNKNINKRILNKILHEFLKDSSIKVRIFSSILLVTIGSSDGLKAIRDMLVIKNKSIQREILNVLGDLKSLEFSFFLISLLKEEYSLLEDIVGVLELLPKEDLKEIDAFIVNIFRKYDRTINGLSTTENEKIEIKSLKKKEVTLLKINIFGGIEEKSFKEGLISYNFIFKQFLEKDILDYNGEIAVFLGKEIIVYFKEAVDGVLVAKQILRNIENYGKNKIYSKRLFLAMKIETKPQYFFGNEMINFESSLKKNLKSPIFINKILTDEKTYNRVNESFFTVEINDMVYEAEFSLGHFYTIIERKNFASTSSRILKSLIEEEERKKRYEKEVETQVKKIKSRSISTSAPNVARDLDDLGYKLKFQLDQVEKYVQKRVTDRETIRNVKKMLNNTYNLYQVEISKIIIE